MSEIPRGGRPQPQIETRRAIDAKVLIKASEVATGLRSVELCGSSKARELVLVKEAVLLAGRRAGMSNVALSAALGVHTSVVSRRYDSAKNRMSVSGEISDVVERILAMILEPE